MLIGHVVALAVHTWCRGGGAGACTPTTKVMVSCGLRGKPSAQDLLDGIAAASGELAALPQVETGLEIKKMTEAAAALEGRVKEHVAMNIVVQGLTRNGECSSWHVRGCPVSASPFLCSS